MILEYYNLDSGLLIEQHTELLCICVNPLVYISRRALKHFVERRKEEFKTKYSDEIVLFRLYFAIDNIENTIKSYDNCILDVENKYIYSKYFETEYKSFLRVVTEVINIHQEIKSIHFKKNKKATI